MPLIERAADEYVILDSVKTISKFFSKQDTFSGWHPHCRCFYFFKYNQAYKLLQICYFFTNSQNKWPEFVSKFQKTFCTMISKVKKINGYSLFGDANFNRFLVWFQNEQKNSSWHCRFDVMHTILWQGVCLWSCMSLARNLYSRFNHIFVIIV